MAKQQRWTPPPDAIEAERDHGQGRERVGQPWLVAHLMHHEGLSLDDAEWVAWERAR